MMPPVVSMIQFKGIFMFVAILFFVISCGDSDIVDLEKVVITKPGGWTVLDQNHDSVQYTREYADKVYLIGLHYNTLAPESTVENKWRIMKPSFSKINKIIAEKEVVINGVNWKLVEYVDNKQDFHGLMAFTIVHNCFVSADYLTKAGYYEVELSTYMNFLQGITIK